jgi:ubiquinone/menaquinone biosynthesis C-methylase UbiE
MKAVKDPEGFEKDRLHKYVDFNHARVLEVGCGEGRLTWKYAQSADMTFGFDPLIDTLRVARADCPADIHNRVHFTNATAYHIPFSSDTFDITILAWSL